MRAILFPLDKVVLDDKEIKLGMTKNDVETVLGQSETYDSSRYYYHDELAIDYSSNDNTVEFIELLGGPDVDDSEEDSRAYRKISVGIYRENYEDRWETIGLGITDYYQ